MLGKILFSIGFIAINLLANIEDVQLLADDVSREGDIITANKNVVVYSQTYLVTADKAVYDTNSSIIELFGNVNMMKGASEVSRSNYAKLNLKTDASSFEALFMMNKELEVWMKSDESQSDDEYYHTRNAVVSSCNVQDPDWTISSSSAMLNKHSKFLHLFNPVFRIGSVPVFYLPYFGFSTDTTRRTGLLPPTIGYKKSEGFFYKQPIYFAPYNQWDLELDPQILTRRGVGMSTTFRFTDSPYSYSEISLGAYKDTQKYRNEQIGKNSNNQSLKNKTHKGIEFLYDRSVLFKNFIDPTLQEALWIEATALNDIDYLDLKEHSGEDHDSLVTSKLNYFLSSKDHYFGAYAKYYIDTQKLGSINENKDTLQEYPSFQYHKFTDSLFLPNLLYSVDMQSHNYTRRIGIKATQYELNTPISLHIPLFNEIATFSFYENFYANYISFDKKANSATDKTEDKDDYYINNFHRFVLSTDLAKAYENFFHTINFGAEYILPGFNKGDLIDKFYYDTDGKRYENFLQQEETKEEFAGYATQYFYTSNGRKFLRHTISQGYYVDENKRGNLKNTIALYPIANLSIQNKVEYSHDKNKFELIQSGLSYNDENFNANIWHTYKQRENNKKDNYITSNASAKLPYHNRIHGSWQYDTNRHYTKLWRVGVDHWRKCWNYGLTYQRKIEPTTTNSGAAIKRGDGVYLTINFYPMGGIHQDFSISKDGDGSGK
ncbi:LPS assembly protein LptD [Campylobacter sp. 9BO]|uniref:LPS-assembly protein LptD n=1 Tax=Campylobacter sp. 9BO TaxID=3424759 RepID=UPI003D354DBD